MNLRPGERALDLGSGGGLDKVLAARAVAPDGAVEGLDLSEAMVLESTAPGLRRGARECRVHPGATPEAMPFDAERLDAAIANGFFNLCPDKPRVTAELFRVLRRGRRAAVAEINFTEPLPRTEISTTDDRFR